MICDKLTLRKSDYMEVFRHVILIWCDYSPIITIKTTTYCHTFFDKFIFGFLGHFGT